MISETKGDKFQPEPNFSQTMEWNSKRMKTRKECEENIEARGQALEQARDG